MKTFTCIAAASVAACVGVAGADPIIGQAIPVPANSLVTVTFVSSSAGWTGNLHWLDGDAAFTPGPVIFNNHAASPGDTFAVGTFGSAGPLMFSYDVVSGTQNLFEMTDAAEINQFSYEATGPGMYRMGIEDIRLPGGDRDYNDIVFDVNVTPVPTGGPIALSGLGAALLIRKRKR